MNTRLWQQLIRLATLLVLLNVVFDLCACLRDAPQPLNAKGSAILTRQTREPDVPACGDNCDSCVCCAAIVVVGKLHYESALPFIDGVDSPLMAAPPDPEPHEMIRPPRS